MYQKNIVSLIILLAITFFRCSNQRDSPLEPEIPELKTVEKALITADNEFGLKLYNRLSEREGMKNVFISPLSISMALGMTLNGANGETRAAMERTLELNGLSMEQINTSYQNLMEFLTSLDPNVRFEIANSIWYRLGLTFEGEFIDLNKTYFDAEVSALDFNAPEAADIMNQWVESKTHGRIDRIITPPIDAQTIMFLMNAIYFKGIWTFQFDEKNTKEDIFYASDGSPITCQMMSQRSLYRYLEHADFQAIDLPYSNGDFCMTIFLPQLSKSVDVIVDGLNDGRMNDWLLNFASDSVSVFLPKFALEYEIKLNDVLSAMGMGIAFSDNADFTKMYAQGGVRISEVRHKSFVEVNEEGTEAAAVTVVEMELTSVPRHVVKIMKIDRPFVFMIRETRSQSILFIGQVVDPS